MPMNKLVPTMPKVPEIHSEKKPQKTVAYDNTRKSLSKFISGGGFANWIIGLRVRDV